MKNENYIQIQGWMINNLELSGNQLLIFAIIYGFSQDGETKFTGSLSYLVKGTRTSRNTVIKALKGLIEKSLILKFKIVKNNVTFNEFCHNEPVVQKLNRGSAETEPGGSAETEPNNTINNNTIKKDNKTLFSVDPISKDILKILNDNKPSKIDFKPTSGNLKDIESRIKDGFKLEDFKKVILFKVQEWKENDKMKKYIRPETLFGSKFNGYLVESESGSSSNDGSNNFKKCETTSKNLL